MINDPFTIWIILLFGGRNVLGIPDTKVSRIVVRNICENKGLVDKDDLLVEDWYMQRAYLKGWYFVIDELPPIEDSIRLPPPYISKPILDFSNKHVQYVKRLNEYDPTMELWLNDAERLRDIWDSIYRAHPDCPRRGGVFFNIRPINVGTTFGRRLHLEHIRSRIGKQDYYHLRWPPPVPLKYFKRAD